VRQHAVTANKIPLFKSAYSPCKPCALQSGLGGGDFRIASLYREWAGSYNHSNNERIVDEYEALSECNKTIETHPKSFGTELCKKLVSEIKEKALPSPPKPLTCLASRQGAFTYKNVNRIYWRQIKNRV